MSFWNPCDVRHLPTISHTPPKELQTTLGKALAYDTDENARKLIPRGRFIGWLDNGHNILVLAIRNQKPACTCALVDQSCPAMINETDESGFNALREAAFSGDLVALELLLYKGADPNGADEFRHTPLLSAIRFRPWEMATLQDPQRSEAEKKMIETIVKMVKMLIAHGADVNFIASENKTALQHHINEWNESYIYPEVIACLVEVGADVTKAVRTDWDNSPELTQKINDSVKQGLTRREAKPTLGQNLQPTIIRYPYGREPTLSGSQLVNLVCSYV